MKFLIIEDERFTAEDLAEDIRRTRPEWTLVKILESVRAAKEFLRMNPDIDLIFSDIELGDGNCFDVFSEIPPRAPVVFCTAYDQFAIEAFQANGIGYLLKPYTPEALAAAIEKFERLTGKQDISVLAQRLRTPQRLMVHHRDKIIPLELAEVALFYLHHEIVVAACLDGRNFMLTQNLGELETMAGGDFFRASRQHLVNRTAIKAAVQHVGRKLLLDLRIPIQEEVTVSKEKATAFLNWLGNPEA